MVLQAGLDLPVWGTAKPNHPVAVTFDGKTTKTTSGRGGKWNVTLPPRQASRNEFTLRVRREQPMN
jgi:sialate O-acetylesterase